MIDVSAMQVDWPSFINVSTGISIGTSDTRARAFPFVDAAAVS